jgi:hypothetical protein
VNRALPCALIRAIKCAALAAAAPALADSTPRIFPPTGHYYERIDASLSWDGAAALCSSRAGYLVTISSNEENDFVHRLGVLRKMSRPDAFYLWIGLRKIGNDPVLGFDRKYLRWTTTEPVRFTAFNPAIQTQEWDKDYHMFVVMDFASAAWLTDTTWKPAVQVNRQAAALSAETREWPGMFWPTAAICEYNSKPPDH